MTQDAFHSEFKAYKAKMDKEISILTQKIDKLGEIVNVNNQMITDFNRKVDMIYNEGTKSPITEETKPKKQKEVKKNVLELIQEKYQSDKTIFDDIIGDSKKILDDNKEKWESLIGNEQSNTQCSILYKTLTISQRNKLQKNLKSAETESEVSKDVESSVFVKNIEEETPSTPSPSDSPSPSTPATHAKSKKRTKKPEQKSPAKENTKESTDVEAPKSPKEAAKKAPKKKAAKKSSPKSKEEESKEDKSKEEDPKEDKPKKEKKARKPASKKKTPKDETEPEIHIESDLGE